MTYPINFLRGISSKDWATENGLVTAAAFQFDENHTKDGWMQQSICWEDNDSVTELMMKQKNDRDEIQFKGGIARVPRESIIYINNLPASRNLMSYERETLFNNPYHGNLLLKQTTEKKLRSIIAATIALHVSDFIPR